MYAVTCINIEHSKFGGFRSVLNTMADRRMLCGNNCVVHEMLPLDGCVGYTKLKDALRVHFKNDDFRPGQLEALLPVVYGRDVFVRMLTRGGKSLCMFLAPFAISRRTICIMSPLISLMDQQVIFCLTESYDLLFCVTWKIRYKLYIGKTADTGVRAIHICSVDSSPDVTGGSVSLVCYSLAWMFYEKYNYAINSLFFLQSLSNCQHGEKSFLAKRSKIGWF